LRLNCADACSAPNNSSTGKRYFIEYRYAE
jgi:hypothetical protein